MKKYSFLLLVPLILFLAQTGFSAECGIETVFNETFHRAKGNPFTEDRTFSSMNGIATIKLYNGGVEHNKKQMVANATIRVNGSIIFDEMQLNKRVVLLEDQVDLSNLNNIEVYLEGKPGSKVTILIFPSDPLLVWPEFESHMSKTLNPYIGDWDYKTGLAITLWDDNSLAYQLSVRSGIVTGPGLPAEGVKLDHAYPNGDFLRLYDYDHQWHYFLDDDSIEDILDDAEYTFRLYAEDPEGVTLDNTPLCSFTEIIHKRPVLNADLNASMFPTLSTPSTHCASEWGIGGVVDVVWTNPANMDVNWITFGVEIISPPGGWITHMIDITPGDTTVTVDTTGGVWTNQLFISGFDEYERRFALAWLFYLQGECPLP